MSISTYSTGDLERELLVGEMETLSLWTVETSWATVPPGAPDRDAASTPTWPSHPPNAQRSVCLLYTSLTVCPLCSKTSVSCISIKLNPGEYFFLATMATLLKWKKIYGVNYFLTYSLSFSGSPFLYLSLFFIFPYLSSLFTSLFLSSPSFPISLSLPLSLSPPQTGMSGSTHLGEADTSLFSDKLYRTAQERTYINGLSVPPSLSLSSSFLNYSYSFTTLFLY